MSAPRSSPESGHGSWTAEAVRGLGVRTDLETALSVVGLGRTKGYQLAKAGRLPFPVLDLAGRYVVPVAPLLRLLGIDTSSNSASVDAPNVDEPALPGAGAATSPATSVQETPDEIHRKSLRLA